MPIYEYRCGNCAHELEALQKISEPALSLCPACNTDALVKQVSAAGFQLKGNGWYATDFRNGGSKSSNGASKSEGEKSESKSDAPASSASGETSAAPSTGCGASCACH